jgi:hypothetical protein
MCLPEGETTSSTAVPPELAGLSFPVTVSGEPVCPPDGQFA